MTQQHEWVRMAREAETTRIRLSALEAQLRSTRISEVRGPVRVTTNGLGEIQNLEIEGVSSEVTECIISAKRACEENAKAQYERYVKATPKKT